MHPLPPSIYIPLGVITLAGAAIAVGLGWWFKHKRQSLSRHHRGVFGD
jgi:hypothetical protein